MSLREAFDQCSPQELVALFAGLSDTSIFMAEYAGGREYRGWGIDRQIAADTFDAINNNSIVTMGAAGVKKLPPLEPWPRPWAEKKADEEPATVKHLFALMSQGKGLKRA